MKKISAQIAKMGERDGSVQVNISYDIIKHVSAQLYTNPRKAIEELVCNGYDAGATECYVRIPKDSNDALVVLDNGVSMDLHGLQNLWKVAQSPKKPDSSGRRIANNRLQIGKFGVGKLAAYALGERLTHVATIKGVSRVVSVSQGEIKSQKGGGPPTFDVYRVTADNIISILAPYLKGVPKPWEQHWPSWTIAIVEDVEQENFARALKIGILRRMITNAIPISDTFFVFLDGEKVPLRQLPPACYEVNVTDTKFRKKLETSLRDYWLEIKEFPNRDDVALKRLAVKEIEIPSPNAASESIKAIDVPGLGPVEGNAILVEDTLTTSTLDERGYVNHGFAVYANGKLINPEDELFGITPRSHAYWRKFLARIEMPGLDEVLLVQRNAVSENKQKAEIARVVLRTLFEFIRSMAEVDIREAKKPPETFGTRISRIPSTIIPMALNALGGGALPKGGLAAVDIEFVSLSETSPAAEINASEHIININTEHPIIAALNDLTQQDQKQWRRVIGEILAGLKLLESYLQIKLTDCQIIEDIEELIDVALRSAASYIRDPYEECIQEIEEASYIGGARFENAVVDAFRSLRMVAWRRGEPGVADGIIEIPIAGSKNIKISIEAKGSKGVISHKVLSSATVDRHREEAGCTSAVAIAREYQTDGVDGQKSGLMRETEGKLPLLTVSAIAKMLRLQKQKAFTYEKVNEILTTSTPPEDLETYIENKWREIPEPGLMKLILEVAHAKMDEQSVNFPDPGMLAGDPRITKKGIPKDKILGVLQAVATTTHMVVFTDPKSNEFKLLAPVETILDAMTKSERMEVPPAPKEKSKRMEKQRGRGKIKETRVH